MKTVTRANVLGYVSAIVSTALATLIRLLLFPSLGNRSPFLFYLASVMFTAWYGGLGPALLSLVLGALAAVYFFIPPAGSFGFKESAELLGVLAYVFVGVAVALLSESMNRAKRRAEANALALNESRKWLSTTLNSIGDGVIATDAEGRVTFINEVAQSLTGWKSEEAISRPLDDVFKIVSERAREAVKSPAGKVLKEGAVFGLPNHTLLIRRDGVEVPIDDSGSPIRDDRGNVIGVVLVFRDVTERKRAEEAVQKWEQVFEQSSWGVIVVNPETNTLQAVNRAYAEMHGYSVEELRGMPIINTLAPEERASWPARARITHEQGHNVYESMHIRKDGARFPVLIDITAVKDRQGRVLYRAANLQDITERKRAEESLKQSEELFRKLLRTFPNGSVNVFDKELRYIIAEGQGLVSVGLSSEKLVGRRLADVFSPESVAYVTPYYRRALAGETVEFELSVGGHHFLMNAAPLEDDAGNIYAIIAVAQDITERKKAGEALKESEERYRELFENANDIVYTLDLAGNLTSLNRAGERITGFLREEVLGKSITSMIPAERVGVMHEVLQRKLAGEPITTYELEIIAKDGRLLTLEVSSRLIYKNGEAVGVQGIARDITERKRAEAERAHLIDALENQRQRINNIVSTVPGVVWEAWGQPGEARQQMNFVSDYVEAMLGYSVSEWLATPNFWLSIVHPDDRDRAAREATAIFASRKGGMNEFRWVAKDRRVLWVEAQSVVVCDEAGEPIGMRGVTMDITARKQTEDAQRFLAEASALLASSLDYETTLASVAELAVPHLADWCTVHILEERGEIRQLAVAHVDPNKVEWAHELQRRYPPDATAPMGVPNVIRTGRPEFYPEITDEMLVSSAQDPERLEILRQVGVKSALIVPLVARGRTLGAITLVAAESGRRYSSNDLALTENLASRAAQAVDNARLYRLAQSARAEAESANRAKDEFLATVSHELRTPLNAILGWSHMLRTGKFDAATSARALETIERNARSQAQLIEDILDVSRIITGKLRLDVRPVELASVVQAAIDAVQPATDAKGIRLQAVLDPRAGPVSGDPDRLQQVVWNLLSNAVKFTPRGGRVQVRLERANSHVEISVSDTGQGISQEFLPQVFDRFRQADSTSTRQHGGLGLGLAIVRHLVEMHGGTVQADSPGEGQGASFTVRLPLMAVHAGAADPARQHPTAESVMKLDPAIVLEGLRVLVVDDEPDTREMLKLILAQSGAEVRACSFVTEALEAIQEWNPDVLVSDIEMPGTDGYDLIRRVRAMATEAGGRMPAVALTAYARTEDRMRALSAGYHMHIAKPVEPAELIVVIASLAGRSAKGLGNE